MPHGSTCVRVDDKQSRSHLILGPDDKVFWQLFYISKNNVWVFRMSEMECTKRKGAHSIRTVDTQTPEFIHPAARVIAQLALDAIKSGPNLGFFLEAIYMFGGFAMENMSENRMFRAMILIC